MKRLVVCADGTWKSRDDSGDATNVEKLCDAVVPVAADGTRQVGGRTLRTHELVHRSTVERHRRLTAPPRGPYAPANLLAHLTRAPEQRDGTHERTPTQERSSAG